MPRGCSAAGLNGGGGAHQTIVTAGANVAGVLIVRATLSHDSTVSAAEQSDLQVVDGSGLSILIGEGPSLNLDLTGFLVPAGVEVRYSGVAADQKLFLIYKVLA